MAVAAEDLARALFQKRNICAWYLVGCMIWASLQAHVYTLESIDSLPLDRRLHQVLFWEPRRVFKRRQPIAAQDETKERTVHALLKLNSSCRWKASPEICQAVRKAGVSSIAA